MAEQPRQPEAKELEQPVLDSKPEPAGEQPQATEDPMKNAQALIDTLNKLGIDSEDPQSAATKLQNMHFASSQMGRYANELGTERQKRQELEARLAALEAARTQRSSQDEFGEIYGQQPVAPSIRPEDVRNVMREEIGNYVAMQNQATQAQLQEYAKIRSDSEFQAVEDLFNKHISNPQVQIAMQSRQTSLGDEYNRVKTTFYKNLALQTRNTLQQLMQQRQQGAAPPHMEQASSQMQGMPVRGDIHDELREMATKSRGTDDDLDAMLNKLLPDDDQFLYQAEEIKQGRLTKGRP
jgi:hypothetical protein